MEDSVKERLKLFLKKNNIKAVDFCKSIGVSSGFISGMRESIQPDKLKSIAINYSILDIGWLLTGIGEMEKKECSDIDTSIRKRINDFFNSLAIFPESVFNNLDEKEKIVRQIEKKENLSADVICAIADRFPAISTEWILRGRGGMLISPSLENDQLSRIEELKEELDMIKGENRLLREQFGLGERKDGSKSA